MTKYREILRLNSMGFSQRNIATTCQCSRNTVAKVLSRAQEEGITWPLPEELTDADLGSRLLMRIWVAVLISVRDSLR